MVDAVTRLNCLIFVNFCHQLFAHFPLPTLAHFLNVVYFFNMIWIFLWHINGFNVRHSKIKRWRTSRWRELKKVARAQHCQKQNPKVTQQQPGAGSFSPAPAKKSGSTTLDTAKKVYHPHIVIKCREFWRKQYLSFFLLYWERPVQWVWGVCEYNSCTVHIVGFEPLIPLVSLL